LLEIIYIGKNNITKMKKIFKPYFLIPLWLGYIAIVSLFGEHIVSKPINGWIQFIAFTIVCLMTAGIFKLTYQFIKTIKL
jgi:hypothetical protein